jgi:hypothetical protein
VSEFFRIHAPPEYTRLTLRQLAVMVHDAEETDDDVTLLKCYDELARREMNGLGDDLFMEFYRDEWHKRMKKA